MTCLFFFSFQFFSTRSFFFRWFSALASNCDGRFPRRRHFTKIRFCAEKKGEGGGKLFLKTKKNIKIGVVVVLEIRLILFVLLCFSLQVMTGWGRRRRYNRQTERKKEIKREREREKGYVNLSSLPRATCVHPVPAAGCPLSLLSDGHTDTLMPVTFSTNSVPVPEQ